MKEKIISFNQGWRVRVLISFT